MKYYYGFIVEVDNYGFLFEDDSRRKPDFIELSEKQYNQLFAEQAEDRDIVLYNGKVFTAPRGLYYIGVDKKWHKKANEDYEKEALTNAKNNKYTENDNAAKYARYNQEFTLTIQDKECVFDTNQTTQADLLTAFAVCSTGATYDGWVTNNGIVLDLTMEDIVLISTVFKEKSNVYDKWNMYKTMIDNATTIEEVKAIVIDYTQNAEETNNDLQ